MLLNWFNAREATEAGTALADEFLLQSEPGSKSARRKGQDVQQLLESFLRRVDRQAGALKLNLFKRARLANSFKWRLLEKGIEQPVVEELTRALVLRIAAGQPSGAVQAPTQKVSGRQSQALHIEGDQLLREGAYREALEIFRQLVDRDGRDAIARNGLGNSLAQLGQYSEAEAEFKRLIGIKPDLPEAHFNLAGVYNATGRYHDAEPALRRALKLRPSYIDARVRLGSVQLMLGRVSEAQDNFEKALRVSPRHLNALTGMGQLRALMGQFAEAETLFKQVLELDERASYAWASLVSLRRMTAADSAWVKKAEALAAAGLSGVDEAALRFAIGKYYDDIQDFPRAFRSYERANQLHKMRAVPFDRDGLVHFVNDLVRVYTPEALASARRGGSDSTRPVLVVGMPRSGTSLVEQIIASHPAVAGAGELGFWTAVVHKHETAVRQQLLDESLRKKIAADYLRELAVHSGSAQRVVDKAPANIDYLGLIHSVFPNARLIYLRRDPIDTCLSCYFQQLGPALNFTMDLEDLAHYYREHQRLMAHWRRVLPADALLEVPYEELVSEQEPWTRRILEFLNLPWDPRTLDFHQNTRAVATASAWQVRQKIYKTSVQRWRNYKKFIGPLLELGDSTT
ncbi:MAG TPA: sulfotransferase [Burkholderiales bacterium]|nr:sulfotransferase [Burkholderiales bacterium]